MNEKHWKQLLDIINGKQPENPAVGFIIDSPWLPGWAGMDILDYYTNDELWFSANVKALETFPDVMFLPGFWSEYGMCSEPSAFGSRCSFPRNEFPHARETIANVEDIDKITPPDPAKDGLGPFILNRLWQMEVFNRCKPGKQGIRAQPGAPEKVGFARVQFPYIRLALRSW
jgi:uroporphyrinogen decarboxylase